METTSDHWAAEPERLRSRRRSGSVPDDPEAAVRDIGEEDWRQFNHLTSVKLNADELDLAARPDRRAPEDREYLAVHWHPEWAPLELIQTRLKRAFPQAENYLAIPTQHNRILTFGPWAGVEADVYDHKLGLKVQLLLHFSADKMGRASALAAMMDKTYNYRAHQLLDILSRLADPASVRVSKCSVSDEAVGLARFFALRLQALIEQSHLIGSAGDEMLKNRLLPDFLIARTHQAPRGLVDQALMFISAVKKEVKASLNPAAFFSPEEVVEEVRGLGGGVIIPHPPQFWPFLMSDLPVDGWEVWNPSTPRHAVFLLEALKRANEARPGHSRPLLAFMGDDTHMSAKFRPGWGEEKDSAGREIGFQDPWTDPALQSLLADAGQSLVRTINEYRSRLT